MTSDPFLKEFHIYVNAPSGIEQLRRICINLAISGKFSHLAVDGFSELKLSDVCTIINGNSISKSKKELNYMNVEGMPYVATKDVGFDRRIDYKNGVSIPDNDLANFRISPAGATLVCAEGGSAGRKIALSEKDCCFGNKLYSITPHSELDPKFLFYYTLGDQFQIQFKSSLVGIIGGVSLSKVRQFRINFPDIKNQRKIVSHLDELMELCDQLEEEQRAAKAFSDELRVSTFHHMVTEKPEDAQDALQILIEESGLLLKKPEDVEDIRDLIMDLAIQGSLTKRGSDVSNVNELVELARTRRKEYLRENKIKEPKTPTVIEKPLLDIPEQWAWVQVNELGIVGPKNTILEDDLSVGFVPMRNVSSSWKETATYEERTWSEIKKGYTHLANGDIAVAKITPCFQNKKSTVIKGLPNGIGAGTTELHVIRPIIGVIIPEYLLTVFKSDHFVKGGVPKMTGTAGQKRIPRDYFSGFVVPLPPLEEQDRIVSRVDELMELCDQLEAKLSSQVELADEYVTSSVHALVS